MIKQATTRQRGFTLVELMVALLVAAISISIAVPSYKRIVTGNQLSSAANTFVSLLTEARMESIKRSHSTQFCGGSSSLDGAGTLGTACNGKNGAVNTLVSDSSGNPTAQQVRDAYLNTASLTITVSTGLVFRAQGLAYQATSTTAPYTGTVVTICTQAISSNNERKVQMVAGGNVTTTTRTVGSC